MGLPGLLQLAFLVFLLILNRQLEKLSQQRTEMIEHLRQFVMDQVSACAKVNEMAMIERRVAHIESRLMR